MVKSINKKAELINFKNGLNVYFDKISPHKNSKIYNSITKTEDSIKHKYFINKYFEFNEETFKLTLVKEIDLMIKILVT